jgi:dihydrofolate reductase
MNITILAAFDEERGLGKDNSIPWRLPEDMKRFKELTTGQTCIMGRKTWESLPKKFRPLPDRVNYVVSRTYFQDAKKFYESFAATREAPTWGAFSLAEAISLATNYYPKREIFIIGGGEIYKQALELGVVNRMVISKVNGTHGCDVFFPEFNEADWSCNESEKFDMFSVVEMTRTKE